MTQSELRKKLELVDYDISVLESKRRDLESQLGEAIAGLKAGDKVKIMTAALNAGDGSADPGDIMRVDGVFVSDLSGRSPKVNVSLDDGRDTGIGFYLEGITAQQCRKFLKKVK
ncbi:MAG: hypothetical protein WC551_08715 [Patescibacteria group bacterium]